MKTIPRKYPTAFFKQGMYGLPTVSYFQTCGIFLHFWGLFEWVLSNVIWSDKSSILETLDSKMKTTKSKRDKDEIGKIKAILIECISAEEILYRPKNWLNTSKKLKLLEDCDPKIRESITSCHELRNAIAHNYVTFVGVAIGAYQQMWGYIKGDGFDKDATEEWKNMLTRAQKNNPNITDAEINTTIWVTYTEQDIKNEIQVLAQAIKELGYDIESDNIYLLLEKKGFFHEPVES